MVKDKLNTTLFSIVMQDTQASIGNQVRRKEKTLFIITDMTQRIE